MKLRAVFALTGLLGSAALIACGPPPNTNTAKKVGKEAAVEGTKDKAPSAVTNVKFIESPRDGDPKVVGCADGQREGFADITKFPTIAGCLAVWDGSISLRKGKTSKACGDDLDVCDSPADVCAEGWHLCARAGDYNDLSDRVTGQQCADEAGPGKFVAGISHVKKKKECAPEPGPTTRYPCLKEGWGAEPVCCGTDCRLGKCRDSVWGKNTRISLGTAQGCGGATSERNGGILCCKDADLPATAPAASEGAAVDGTAAAVDAAVDEAGGAEGAEAGAAAAPSDADAAGDTSGRGRQRETRVFKAHTAPPMTPPKDG